MLVIFGTTLLHIYNADKPCNYTEHVLNISVLYPKQFLPLLYDHGAERMITVHFSLGETQRDVGYLIITWHILTISISQVSTVNKVLKVYRESVFCLFCFLQVKPIRHEASVRGSSVRRNSEQTITVEDEHLLWPARMKRKYKWGKGKESQTGQREL